LNNNKIAKLPVSIGFLETLDEFTIAENDLLYLPEEIGGLISLEYFDISGNSINELPPNIGLLENLIELKMNGNGALGYIPNNVCDLEGLETVVIDRDSYVPGCWLNNRTRFPQIIVQ